MDLVAALKAHQSSLQDFHLREAFETDPDRATRFAVRDDDLLLDYSKNLVTGSIKSYFALHAHPHSIHPSMDVHVVVALTVLNDLNGTAEQSGGAQCDDGFASL